ncbi:SX2_G0009890.mRNA.1.CDS.1 [Saccharomyces cerevisiae]|nr:SX2_G0009890.mRNA.1.CDS.1 [Saccharomyces cerevisiae]
MVTKKTTFAQLITRLNHFLCQTLKRRDSKTYIPCRTAVFGAIAPFSPRKSHINNNYPCNPGKKNSHYIRSTLSLTTMFLCYFLVHRYTY